MSKNAPSLQEALAGIRDFRHPQGKRYKLHAILVLTCLAIVHGAQSEEDIADWGDNEGRRLLKLLGIRRHRGPSLATIQRIFKGIDKIQLEEALTHWSQTIFPENIESPHRSDSPCLQIQDSEIASMAQPERSENSLGALNHWVESMMGQLQKTDVHVEDDSKQRESLFERLVLSGFGDTSNQHISEAGLKIWAVDDYGIDKADNAIDLDSTATNRDQEKVEYSIPSEIATVIPTRHPVNGNQAVNIH